MAKTGIAKPNTRIRRSFRQIFIDHLGREAKLGKSMVSKPSVCRALGWQDSRYDSVRDQLFSEGIIVVGPGQGGTVGLANLPGAPIEKKASIFISYAHEDEGVKDDLLKHLMPLKRSKKISSWHDREIKPGENWALLISDNIGKADIIVFLVSIDFINSDYCFGIEMQMALERENEKTASVIPVIVRNCMWKDMPFARLLALPRDGKAIASWPDRDSALTSVAEGISEIVDRILSN